MAGDKTYECPKCGLTVPRFAGPVPTECPAWMPAKNRARAIERLRKRDPELADRIETAVAAGQEAQTLLDDDPPEMKAALRADVARLVCGVL